MSVIVSDAPERRRRGRWVYGLLALVLIAVVAVWAYLSTRPRPAVVTRRDIVGAMELSDAHVIIPPQARADVMPPYRTAVSRVAASVGAHVRRGDVLVVLSLPAAQSAVDLAQQRARGAETAYANAQQQYGANVAAAQQQLSAAEAAARAAAPPGTPAPGPSGSADSTQAAVAVAQARQALQQAQADRDAAAAPYRQQLDDARSALAQARAGARAADLRAPISGTVMALNAQPGKEIGTDSKTPVATIVNLEALQIQAKLTPEQASQAKPDMPVLIRLKELPAREITGRLGQITTAVDTKVGGLIKRQEYVGVIHFKNDDEAVRPEMTPMVAVKTGEVKDALAVPNEAVERDRSGRIYVRVQSAGKWVETPVTLGLTDGQYTEVKTGLKPGQVVQVTPSLANAATLRP